MTTPTGTEFVYVTYIRTTPEKLWDALTQAEFTREYFFGATHETDWKVGSPWRLVGKDGVTTDAGEVLEIEPLKKIVLKWGNEFRPELKAEGYGRCEITMEAMDDAMKLTIRHSIERPDSKLINAVSNGWPRILSNLKSLLETGSVVQKAK